MSSRAVAAIVMVLVLVASVFVLVQSRGNGGGGTEIAAPAGEIFLEPANAQGQNPFTENVAGEVFVPATTVPLPSTTTSPAGQTAVLSSSGTTPGLYGGTRDNSRCDQAQMAGFLEANTDKAQAWADAQGIAVTDVRSYIDSLTPVQLRADTRVTNHGFRGGRATPLQSVLQSGTSVLVDETGVPRARCACGNPLVEPAPVSGTPTYAGPQWDSFDPQQLVVVQPGPAVQEHVLADFDTGTAFVRPVGTSGEADVPAPEGTDVSDPLAAGSVVTTPTTQTTQPGATGLDRQITVSGAATMSDVVRQEAAAADAAVSLDEASIDLTLRPDGAVSGSFAATFRTDEQGCTYRSTFSGQITGTHDGQAVTATWAGQIDEEPLAGDCEGLIVDADDMEGTVTGTIDPVRPGVRGVLALMGLELLDFDLEV